MVVNNPYLIPKVEEVRYLNTEIPSYEEFLRNYKVDERVKSSYLSEIHSQVKGYGPCKYALCGCHCPKDECDCRNFEFYVSGGDGRKISNGTASGGIGLGGNSFSGDVDLSLYRETRWDGDVKFGTLSAGVDLVNGGLGGQVKFGANVVDVKTHGVEVKAGLNLDTGAKISSDGLTLKAAGTGITIGKKIEVSTIFGGVSVDTSEDCVIQ